MASSCSTKGHINKRSRGDSRLRDWPDVEWRLVRQGRRPGGGSRHDARAAAALDAVLDVLSSGSATLSGRAIKQAPIDGEHARER